MQNNKSIPIDRLRVLFSELLIIMENENEEFWIHHVHTCLTLLEDISDGNQDSEKLETLKSLFKGMLTGYANISDFFVWKEDFDERIEANKKLNVIQKEIWESVKDFIYTWVVVTREK